MGFDKRKGLYEQISKKRKRPLIAYVTSGRQTMPGATVAAQGIIAMDALPQFVSQLKELPKGTKDLDILVNSFGGDGLASWRIITMIREYLGDGCKLSCLVPHYAFSAATLLALGCDEIVLHPLASLGPVDPQMTVAKKDGMQQFAYQDVTAYTAFVQEEAGITEQKEKVQLISQLANQIEPSAIGAGKRAAMQSIVMAEKLLKLHMKGENAPKAAIIAEQLSKNYFSHGHAVSRSEAMELELMIADSDPATEDLIWELFKDFEDEMQMNDFFNPMAIYLSDPASAALMAAPPIVNVPSNTPPQMAQQMWNQILSNLSTSQGPVLDFALMAVVVEGLKSTARWMTRGKIFGFRQPDSQLSNRNADSIIKMGIV